MQGNVEVHDASAWGRRIFNEAEIDAVDEEELHTKYAVIETEEGRKYISCTDRDKLLEVGLWDMVYNSGWDFLNMLKLKYLVIMWP